MQARRAVLGGLTGRVVLAAVTALALGGLAACGGSASGDAGSSGTKASAASKGPVRLGYFPNVTHATAIVGVERGIFAKALGSRELKTTTFNAGPAAVEALNSGAIDATYIGPGPTINAYVKSAGKALVVVSGATSGGAALVVKPSINKPADLRGKKLATPQLGNTQDVALRYWLSQQGFKTTTEGGGDVKITPQENPQTLEAFTQGLIDGAWVPEPYVGRLVAAGGRVLVDERTLWPGGRFVTTHLVVRRSVFDSRPDVVQALVKAQVESNAWVNANPAEAQRIVTDALTKLSGKPVKPKVVADAWKTLTFTDDPVAASLREDAKHAAAIGLLKNYKGDDALKGLYQLDALNAVLEASGAPKVSS